MKKHLTIGLLALLCAGGAAAQMDPGPDGIGLYFDEAATEWCASYPTATMFDMYLCLTNPTAAGGIAGWEAMLEWLPDNGMLLVVNWDIGQAYNISTQPELVIGCMTPLPTASIVVLAHMQALYFGAPERYEFFIRPTTRASIPGVVCYADAADPRNLIQMNPSTGSYETPVAILNGFCDVIETEATSWSRVKALYAPDGEVSR